MVADAATWQKEQVSRAFGHALATQGGYTICDWNVDKDGVDVTLRSRGLMVDIQLKWTQSPRVVRSGYSFDLDIETYDKLSDPECSAPGHLALLIVPSDFASSVVEPLGREDQRHERSRRAEGQPARCERAGTGGSP